MQAMEAMNLRFVIGAYVVTWVVLTAYAIYVHGAARRARAEYDRANAKGAK